MFEYLEDFNAKSLLYFRGY